jgi:serine/threonine protein kinase
MIAPRTEILVTRNGEEVTRITVSPGEYVIGRDHGCDVQIESEDLSRKHALLVVNFDHALIEDQGSSNGTFVNDIQITSVTRLWPNQRIRLGAATMISVRRLKTENKAGESLTPTQAFVKSILPDEILRDKKYDIGGVVAQGGMGAILNAKESITERTVAMKVMLDSLSHHGVMRFISEAKVTAQLEHPNIVPVYELGVDENEQVFYTMKLVKGETLMEVIEKLSAGDEETSKKYPLPALLTLFQKVCDAVAFAHSKGVIHRDLKPENVMIGGYGEVLVMDWGLAKVLSGDESTLEKTHHVSGIKIANDPVPASFTLDGAVLGTPQYMSPEQAKGNIELIDELSDIYSLGAIFYSILTLRPPVAGENAHDVVNRVMEGKVEPLTPFNKKFKIPDSLVAVVKKAMSVNRKKRYQSVAALQSDLTAFQNGFATMAERAGVVRQLLLLIQRNKGVFTTAFAAWMLISVLAFGFVINLGEERNRAEVALRDLRKTAPTFFAQAQTLFETGKYEDAVDKVSYAIQLDPRNPDYLLYHANLLESSQKLYEAADDYRKVLALRKNDASARINLGLCERLIKESGNQGIGNLHLGLTQQLELLTSLRQQKRLLESAPLATAIDPDIASAKAVVLGRLLEFRKQQGWKFSRVNILPDGTYQINLDDLNPEKLSVLKHLPVTQLSLSNCGITDLSELSGLPLKVLNLSGNTTLRDLSPLRGMPLETLNLYHCASLSDLSALKGMKIHSLNIKVTSVADLSPLTGMPLQEFICGVKKIADQPHPHGKNMMDQSLRDKMTMDFYPLSGDALINLEIDGIKVNNLEPLAHSSLKTLVLHNNRVADLSPLKKCSHLEQLVLSGNPVKDLSPLSKLPLHRLNCSDLDITNVLALRGMPLRFLSLQGTSVTDLRPLGDCISLEEIVLPEGAKDLSMLRNLPNLHAISTRSMEPTSLLFQPLQSAVEFWKQYNAKHPISSVLPSPPPAKTPVPSPSPSPHGTSKLPLGEHLISTPSHTN